MALVNMQVHCFVLDSFHQIVVYYMENKMDYKQMVVDYPILVEVVTTMEVDSIRH